MIGRGLASWGPRIEGRWGSLGIPQGDVHKSLTRHKQQIFTFRIEEVVSLKSLHLNVGPDIYLVCSTNSFFTNIVIESSWMGAIWRPCSIQRGGAKLLRARLCACWLFWYPAFTKLQCWTSQCRFEVHWNFWGVRSLILCCHCRPPMQTPLVCNFHGVLPNIKLSYTPMSSANSENTV